MAATTWKRRRYYDERRGSPSAARRSADGYARRAGTTATAPTRTA